MNQRLFVGGDVSFNSRLVVYSDVSFNSRLFVAGDVSINQRLFVVGDTSLNGNAIINGNLICNNYLKVNHIGENISSATYSSGTVTINYNTSNSLYLISSVTGNFTLNITNFPTDNNSSYTTTLLIPAAYFCNVLSVNTTAKTLLCSGSSISSYSVTGSTFVVQSISIVNSSGTTANYAVTNISSYQ